MIAVVIIKDNHWSTYEQPATQSATQLAIQSTTQLELETNLRRTWNDSNWRFSAECETLYDFSTFQLLWNPYADRYKSSC